jgi:hypothetical protein
MPTPAAPEKIASAERLMPTALTATATAVIISPRRIIFTSSTWTDGVRSLERAIQPSAMLLMRLVSHSAMIRTTPSLIRISGVSRKPPSTTSTESSASMVGPSCPMMESAATSQAEIDTTRTMNGLRKVDVTSRIASQASASLALTINR